VPCFHHQFTASALCITDQQHIHAGNWTVQLTEKCLCPVAMAVTDDTEDIDSVYAYTLCYCSCCSLNHVMYNLNHLLFWLISRCLN